MFGNAQLISVLQLQFTKSNFVPILLIEALRMLFKKPKAI